MTEGVTVGVDVKFEIVWFKKVDAVLDENTQLTFETFEFIHSVSDLFTFKPRYAAAPTSAIHRIAVV